MPRCQLKQLEIHYRVMCSIELFNGTEVSTGAIPMVWQVGTAVLYLDLERREGQREGPKLNCYWDPVVQGKERAEDLKEALRLVWADSF